MWTQSWRPSHALGMGLINKGPLKLYEFHGPCPLHTGLGIILCKVRETISCHLDMWRTGRGHMVWWKVYSSCTAAVRVSQTKYLKITEACLQILRLEVWNHGVSRSTFSPVSREESFLAPSSFCCWLPGILGMLTCCYITPVSAATAEWPCVCLSVSFLLFLKDTNHTGFRVYPNAVWLHLNSSPLQQPYFQIKSHSEVLGVRASTYLLWRTQWDHNRTETTCDSLCIN